MYRVPTSIIQHHTTEDWSITKVSFVKEEKQETLIKEGTEHTTNEKPKLSLLNLIRKIWHK